MAQLKIKNRVEKTKKKKEVPVGLVGFELGSLYLTVSSRNPLDQQE